MGESAISRKLRSHFKAFPKDLRDYAANLLIYSPVPLFYLDEKLSLIAANSRFLNKLKYTLSEAEGRTPEELFPESLRIFRKAVSRLSDQQKADIKNLCISGKNNTPFDASVSMSRLKKERSVLIMVFVTKIENRKEILLKESTPLDEFLSTISNRGKWFADPVSGLFFANQICFTLLGLKPKANYVNLSAFINRFSNNSDKETLEKDFFQLKNNKSIISREFKILHQENSQNSETRYVELIFGSFTWNDKEYIAGIIDNITSFKKTEKDLFKSRSRLEKMNHFKTVFLNNLSHEIRTPMNSVLGFGELLNQPNLSQKDIRSYTSIIKAKGNYLLSLIDDVIEISRFESGKIKFNYSQFSLLPLLNELFNDLDNKRKETGKINIDIHLDLPTDAENHEIYTDYGRLQQLLSNLLSNALKFTEKGHITLGYKISARYIKFHVEDTGIGLSPEDQTAIFNRFENADEISLNKLSGTGLSLTISRLIVEELGGKIKVKSQEKRGSRFQLSVPLLSPPKNKLSFTNEEIGSVYDWKDKIILVAEDEEVSYMFLETILHKTKAQIIRARNGREVVDLCKKINPIDLVLMDIRMPEMNGYEAFQQISQHRPGLPVIAQTAYSSQADLLKAKQMGFDDYVTKPLDIEDLFEKIDKLFKT